MELNSIPIPDGIIGESKVVWMTKNMNKFCVLPWINLHTSTNGDIKLCCNIQYNSVVTDGEKVFNLGRDPIESIWNSGYMRYTREMHRANLEFSPCLECYNIEKVSGHSPRMGQNVEWIDRQSKDKNISTTLEVAAKEEVNNLDHLPISLELRLGNQCNLQCITCWGMSSSLIHTERTKLLSEGELDNPDSAWLKKMWVEEQDTVNATDVKHWFDTDMFYENFKKIAPKLKRLYTTGGEPTLIKANYKMMQMLLDAGNTECSIEFTSNMTTWNPEFYNRLEKFKNVEIQISIDAMGLQGEFIRYPSDINKVTENVFKAVEMASINSNWKIKCYTVLQSLNYRHLLPIWEILRQAADNYNKRIDWWPITLYAPPFLGLAAVPIESRLSYLNEFKLLTAEFNSKTSYFTINASTMNPCIDSIKTPEFDPSLHEKLKQYLILLDKSRKTNGFELFKTDIE